MERLAGLIPIGSRSCTSVEAMCNSHFLMHIFGQLTVPKSEPKQEYTASATKFMELIPQFRLNDYSGRKAHQDVKVSDIIFTAPMIFHCLG